MYLLCTSLLSRLFNHTDNKSIHFGLQTLWMRPALRSKQVSERRRKRTEGTLVNMVLVPHNHKTAHPLGSPAHCKQSLRFYKMVPKREGFMSGVRGHGRQTGWQPQKGNRSATRQGSFAEQRICWSSGHFIGYSH